MGPTSLMAARLTSIAAPVTQSTDVVEVGAFGDRFGLPSSRCAILHSRRPRAVASEGNRPKEFAWTLPSAFRTSGADDPSPRIRLGSRQESVQSARTEHRVRIQQQDER